MVKRHGRLSIFAVLLSGLLLTSALGIGTTLYLGLQTAIQNTRNLWITMTSADIADAERVVAERLARTARRNVWIATRVAQDSADPLSPSFWTNQVASLIATDSAIAAIGVTRPDGSFIGFDQGSKTFVQTEADTYDQMIGMQMLKAGPSQSQTLFPYWQSMLGQAVIGQAIPLFQNGQYVGLLTQYLTLPGLSRDLRIKKQGDGRTAFVTIGDHIIAHPRLSNWQVVNMRAENSQFRPQTLEEATSILPRMDEIGDPVLSQRARWQPVELGDSVGNALDRGIKVSQILINGEYQYVVTRAVSDESSSPITFGVHFEPSVFQSEGQRVSRLFLIGLVVLISAFLAAGVIAHYFSRPLKRFSVATRQFEEGNLQDVPQLPPSRIAEFNQAAISFNHMVHTLNDRARIEQLFGKFLPTTIAQTLLQSKNETGTIPPRKCIATTLFVDLQGFTSMSEKADPQDVVNTLNAYFADATEIIEARNGIITQFQGDAILAVYNAVGELPSHADAALETAIALQKLVHSKDFNGVTLRCRCGVNTGELVAASVGAPDRLSFTVNGDSVNSAARLEAMNKELGTKILIGQTTRDRLEDPSRATLAKEVLLRGRSETTAVYTVCIDGIDPPKADRKD